MQLAASQRSHPPPVPPRPSRQVVAEALKRSPRPPCPTRQAPPPPNAKPWRSTDQETSSKAGRTVVYESSKDNDSESSRDPEPNIQFEPVVRAEDGDLESDSESRSILKGTGDSETDPILDSDLEIRDSREVGELFVEESKIEKELDSVKKELRIVEREGEKETRCLEKKESVDKRENQTRIADRAGEELRRSDKKEREPKTAEEKPLIPEQKKPRIPEHKKPRVQKLRIHNQESSIPNQKPSTLNLEATTLNQESSTLNQEPTTLNQEPSILNQKQRIKDSVVSTETDIYSDEENLEFSLRQCRRPSVESLLENEIYDLVEECRLKNLEKRDGQDPREIRLGDIQLDPSRPRLRSQKMNLLSRERVRGKIKDDIDGPQIRRSQKPLGPKPQERVRPPIPARNSAIQIEDRRKEDGRRLNFDNTRIAPSLKPRQRFECLLPVTNVRTGSERNKSISSDDGATVVIVDEPERKVVAFNEDGDNIHHQDWLEAGVRYSSTQITLSGDEAGDRVNGFAHLEDEVEFGDLDFSSILERIAMSSLQGLPPLPRSLSGFNLNSGRGETGEPPPPPTRSSSRTQRSAKTPTNVTQSSSRPSPPARQLTTLDTQLAILRREMFGLRQLDLSLLSQLWSLNESIQEFRQLLQDQEDRAPSPSPSSEDGDDNSYGPQPRRPAPTLHHHRPPRPPRPPKPPPSDESPSSEEYGAV